MGLEIGIDRGRLPPGTHGLDPADVVHSQRMRMYFGVLEAVSERGYAAVTVADIVARANVSRRTFYQQFRGRDDCFAAAFQAATDYILGHLDASVENVDRGDWRALIRITLDRYLTALADNGPCARAMHTESLVAGPVVAAQRRAMKSTLAQRMAAVFRIGRATGEIPAEVPGVAFEALIGALDDRVRDCLEGPGPRALPALTPDLYRITLALFGVPEWGEPGR
ncbi:TetR/AcrR family transcriptional regulator [Nocardia terpenica]|uniref:TetR family transcriptional regulator n=1 Tax=Nocardia terpenica TaxID=455432 RepID=A0A291RG35_9NOCA|nr:TetR/AcrR family transcriptional regulator [Nocardia terpenica]ATL66543.1 TetR family transcriptional regulator [Nocardia terpenica]